MPASAAPQQIASPSDPGNPLTGDVIAVDGLTPVFNHPRMTVAGIKEAVCGHFSLLPIEMVSHRRARRVARPRQIAMALCRDLTPLSLPAIGRHFGGRDHTTVMHAIKTVEGLAESDSAFAWDLAEIRRSLAEAP